MGKRGKITILSLLLLLLIVIAAGANYYLGGGDLKLSGKFDGYVAGAGDALGLELPSALENARLDFTGLEIILGVEIEL